ncbi:MAG: ABC transporter ATP-binding protein [Hyphomicrobiaceae bacterium]
MTGRPLIQAHDLVRHYTLGEQTVKALDGVSIDIAKGEMVAIMGPSGSGKSTLMNLIGALDVATSGSLKLDGEELTEMGPDRLADIRNRRIGFVFQQFNLLPRTGALAQVMLPLLYKRDRPKEMAAIARKRLEQVGLGDRLDHTPRQLSGGQQQRVAIARALVNDPEILLADEPTGALDSKTATEIMQLLSDLNRRGITVIIVTHEPDVASFALRRILFRDGRIVEDVQQPGYPAMPPWQEHVAA